MSQKKNYTLFDTNAYKKLLTIIWTRWQKVVDMPPTHSPPLRLFLVCYPPHTHPPPCHVRLPQVSDAASTLAAHPFGSLVSNTIPVLMTSTLMSLVCAPPPFHLLPSI